MSFREPLVLVGLGLLPLAVAAYVAAQQRRRRFAVRYTNVDILASVATASPLRHLPALLALLALAALLVAMARPERTVAAKREEATVIMVTDTSGSMLAKDVRPDRLTAAREAARTLTAPGARGLPARADQVRLARRAGRRPDDRPDADGARAAPARAWPAAPRWATGSSSGWRPRRRRSRTGSAARASCRRRSCCSPTARARAAQDPIDIAQQAKRAKIRIYTVALGTPGGMLETKRPDGTTRSENVPPDTLTLQEIARDTGGRYFNAPDADQLEAVYSSLATRFATVQEKQEMTATFAGGGLVLLLGGLAFSLLRGGRLP